MHLEPTTGSLQIVSPPGGVIDGPSLEQFVVGESIGRPFGGSWCAGLRDAETLRCRDAEMLRC